jgi:hypothetical protein
MDEVQRVTSKENVDCIAHIYSTDQAKLTHLKKLNYFEDFTFHDRSTRK